MYFQRLVPFFTAIGTPAFRAWVVDLLPLKSIRMMKYIADAIHSQATIVFEDKKAALNAGDEALTKRIGEGKDLMSILCELRCIFSQNHYLLIIWTQ